MKDNNGIFTLKVNKQLRMDFKEAIKERNITCSAVVAQVMRKFISSPDKVIGFLFSE